MSSCFTYNKHIPGTRYTISPRCRENRLAEHLPALTLYKISIFRRDRVTEGRGAAGSAGAAPQQRGRRRHLRGCRVCPARTARTRGGNPRRFLPGRAERNSSVASEEAKDLRKISHEGAGRTQQVERLRTNIPSEQHRGLH